MNEYKNKHSIETEEITEKRKAEDRVLKRKRRSTENVETIEERRKQDRRHKRQKLNLEKDKQRKRKIWGKPSKNWKNELINKSSLIYICTSECRYRPKGSVVLVSKQKFNEIQEGHLTLNEDTKSIDSEFYICKECRKLLKKMSYLHVMKRNLIS